METIISTDVGSQIKTIADLRKEVSQLRAELNQCAVGSEEAAQKSLELQLALVLLSAAQKGAITSTQALNDSYNGLSARMAALKAEWKATTDEAQRALLGKLINDINDKLKELDASTGNFQRNVGDYANLFASAFSTLGGSAGKAVSGIVGGAKSVGAALKTLSANPIMLAVTVLVGLVSKLIERFKSTAEGAATLRKAMAPLLAIMNVFSQILDKVASFLGNGIAKGMELFLKGLNKLEEPLLKVVGFLQKIPIINMLPLVKALELASKGVEGINDRIEEENVLAEKKAELDKLNLETAVKNAELEKEAAEWAAKAKDAENLSAEERKKALEEELKLRQLIIDNLIKKAQLELEIMLGEHARSESSQEDLLAEADKQAEIIKLLALKANAEKLYNSEVKEVNNLIKALQKAAVDAYRKQLEEIKKAKDEAKLFSDSLEEALKLLMGENYINSLSGLDKELAKINADEENAVDEIEKKRKEALEKNAKAYKKGSKEREKADAEVVETYEELKRQTSIKYDRLRDEARKKAEKAEIERLNKLYDDVYAGELERARTTIHNKYLEDEEALKELLKNNWITQQEYEDRVKELKTKEAEDIHKKEIELDKDLLERREKLLSWSDTTSELTAIVSDTLNSFDLISLGWGIMVDAMGSATSLVFEGINVALEDGKISMEEYTQLALQASATVLSGLGNMFGQLALEKELYYNDLAEKLELASAASIEAAINAAQAEGKSLEEVTALRERLELEALDLKNATLKQGFEESKKFQIVSATMSMLAGIASAWASAMQLGPIAGPIVGAVLSVLMGTMGGILIAKIKQQKFESGGTATASNAAAPNTSAVTEIASNPVVNTQDVLGALIEQSISDQKVYVLESDILNTANKVEVAESEATF